MTVHRQPRARRRPTAIAALASLPLVLALAACGPEDGSADAAASVTAGTTSTAPTSAPKPAPAPAVGTVTAVVPITATDKPTGAGAVVGGVVGAAVGNQIGDGNGRKVATVLGALGGAKVGHEVEKRRSEHVTGYRVDVKMDSGASRSFTLASTGGFSTGQRVRVVDGQILPA